MTEQFGNMFENYLAPEVIYGITTNGYVKNDGSAVMGRGTARTAATLHKNTPRLLGDLILSYGNRPFLLPGGFVTIPVKHHWKEKADPELIEDSLDRLSLLLRTVPIRTLYLPRPGCGNGQLEWYEVKWMVLDFCEVMYQYDREVVVWSL